MQQPEPMGRGEDGFMTLLVGQREVEITREPRRNSLQYRGIEPICLPIGTRSLSISREAMMRMKQLYQNPALLPRPKFPRQPSIPEENNIHGERNTS